MASGSDFVGIREIGRNLNDFIRMHADTSQIREALSKQNRIWSATTHAGQDAERLSLISYMGDEVLRRRSLNVTYDYIKSQRGVMQEFREQTSNAAPYDPVSAAIADNIVLALSAIKAVRPNLKSQATPSIVCTKRSRCSVVTSYDGGHVTLPKTWKHMVHREGIAVACIGANDIGLVVDATRRSSAFLSDMGIDLYDATVMRIGVKADVHEGHVFRANLPSGGSIVKFNANFNRGVSEMKSAIDELFHEEFEKVQ